MSDNIKIVIEIPKDIYARCKEYKLWSYDAETLEGAVATSKLLSEVLSENKGEPIYYPPCIDCNKKMDEIRRTYDKLKEMPSAENKGEWITDKERLGYWISTCSKCKHIFHGNELLIYKPNFCPNCGADMRGE